MHKLLIMLSTCFGIGIFRFAPGTLASFFALLTMVVLPWSIPGQLAAALIFSLLGIFICDYAEKKIFFMRDPQSVVFDEFTGMYIALANIPFRAEWKIIFLYFLAFITFRLLDIFKPGIIREAERFEGGLGIMADDIAAGVFTCLLVNAVRLFFL
ncbi:MAG: hypothetical protein A2096_11915 [Spirochaetes bacterium GWF1_41_5]|nr:MAG: hypothetical protein A2096_11915 [Spirochaetes bacterium GWF1_41_5]